MNTAAFDTHAAVKALQEAGADEAMAEAIVNTANAAAGAGHDALATKADLAALETRLRNTLSTKADLAGLRAELGTVRWTVGLIAAFLFAIGLRVFGLI